MKKWKVILAGLMLALSVAVPSHASIQVFSDDVEQGFVTKLSMKSGNGVKAGELLTLYPGIQSTLTTNVPDAANAVWGTSNGVRYEGATADTSETTVSPEDPTADRTIVIPNMSGTYMVTSVASNITDAATSVLGTSNGFIAEGTTADAFETTFSFVDPTADQTVSVANAGVNNALMFSTLTTNTIDAANSVWGISNGLVMEGATADTFETTVSPADPTADQTVTIPNFAVGFSLVGSTLTTNTVDAANSVWFISNSQVFEGATADSFETTVTVGDPTADQTVTIPATAGAAGTVELKGVTVVITAGASPTLTVPLGVDFIATDTITTDNQDQTITFSTGGSVGQIARLIFQTDSGGSADEVITFQTTLTNTVGTLTLANATAQRYVVCLQSDGTVWNEISRTAILS